MTDRYSPNAFMRARRPDRFSDSEGEDSALSRESFEYHLDTITNRNQESEFARFAKAVAEREICPNLLPQTGPTGGGDSKVDTETYPVAEQLAVGWLEGLNIASATERWAFAISAKRAWQPKVRSDVKKIVETRRGYTKIFFITNQFVPDKKRAATEDALRQEHGVDIRIFDRSWLVNAVLDHGREDIAIATLGVAQSAKPRVRIGPRDATRQTELEAADRGVEEALAAAKVNTDTVEDALRSALLARGLERSPVEIQGRFQRARTLADRFGTGFQRLRARYESAWTAFWWFEDGRELADRYTEVESLARGTASPYHLELLSNLWMCLRSAVDQGLIEPAASSLEEHSRVLDEELARIATDALRPGTAAYARSLQLQLKLIRAPESSVETFSALAEIIRTADGLVNYPLEDFTRIVSELGDLVGALPGYEALFEATVEVTSRRKGEVESARLRVARGQQLLKSGDYLGAVRVLGSALRDLYKDESRDDLIRALYFCAGAYSLLGLPWAARGTLVTAASLATDELWLYGKLTRWQRRCYNRLRWTELELGRLPLALAWHELTLLLSHASRASREGDTIGGEEDVAFGSALSSAFLRADLPILRQLEALPDALDRLHIPGASVALLWALGHEQEVPVADGGEEEDSDALFRRIRDIVPAEAACRRLTLGHEPRVVLSSVLLGCHVETECENVSPCLEVADAIHAAMEALLATARPTRAIATIARINISVRRSEYAESPFSFRLVEERGLPAIFVACRDISPGSLTAAEQALVSKKLTDLLILVVARGLTAKKTEDIVALFGDDRALERAVSFAGTVGSVRNVLGDSPKNSISHWIGITDRRYPLQRLAEWDRAERLVTAGEGETPREALNALGGEMPARLLQELDVAKHREIEVLDVIRNELWDRARWRGVGVALDPRHKRLPLLLLLFEIREAAEAIFEIWRETLGARDQDERIYVGLVRHVSRTEPTEYRAVVSGRMTHAKEDGVKLIVGATRMQSMVPKTARNLDMFLEAFGRAGRYLLAPAVASGNALAIAEELSIEKRVLRVCDAWQVGRHDVESFAILDSDDPPIPEGQNEAPILEVLRLLRERRGEV